MSENTVNTQKRSLAPKDHVIGILSALGLGLASLIFLPAFVTPVGHIWLACLCRIGVRRGFFSAYLGAALMTGAAFLLFGGSGAFLVGVVTFGALLVMTYLLRPKFNFTTQLLMGSAGLMGIILCAIVIFQQHFGSVIELIVGFMHDAMTLTPEMQKTFELSLTQLYGEGFTLDTWLYLLEESLRINLPGDVLAYCVFGAGFAVFVARKTAAKLGCPEFAGAKEDLSRWAMPRYSARTLGGAALLVYILSMTSMDHLAPAAGALTSLFEALFAIHGACMLSFIMRFRGAKPGWRTTLCAALLIFLPFALAMTAVFERMFPSPRTMGKNGKIMVIQNRKDGKTMQELDDEELPEFFKELMREMRGDKDAPQEPYPPKRDEPPKDNAQEKDPEKDKHEDSDSSEN